MRAIVAVLAVAALVSASAMAAPQKVYGTPPDDLAVEAMHNFSACVVDTTPRGAEAVLAMDYRSDAYKKAIGKLAQGHGRCAPGSTLRFNQVLFAGGMAERLIMQRVKPTQFAGLVAREGVEARSVTEAMTLCVVRSEPAKTWALFESTPASREEGQAIEALSPTLSICLRGGRQERLNFPALRSLLAIAAQRLVQPATPAQGS